MVDDILYADEARSMTVPRNVHWIDGDFIALFSNRFNPLNTVIERISLTHERRLEHEICLHSKIEFLKTFNRSIP